MLLSPNTLASSSTLLGNQIGAPPSDTPNLFGSLIGNPNVEDAVLTTLRAWLPICLAEVERRNGLRRRSLPRPPCEESFFADLDSDGWHQDICPAIIAIVNPTGDTERNGSGYGSWFEVEIAAIVVSEDAARLAGWYGLAVAMAIAQNGGLGGLATDTVLVNAPTTDYPDTDKRILARSTTVFHSFIDGLVNPASGPSTPTPVDSPQYPGNPDDPFGDWPTVVTPSVTLVAEPPA